MKNDVLDYAMPRKVRWPDGGIVSCACAGAGVVLALLGALFASELPVVGITLFLLGFATAFFGFCAGIGGWGCVDRATDTRLSVTGTLLNGVLLLGAALLILSLARYAD